ncbi:MAG: hypothetical protein M0Z27_01360 [Thermaerobacter sp.]|nr:hypothetical protein [Thermaerobacter sp.]
MMMAMMMGGPRAGCGRHRGGWDQAGCPTQIRVRTADAARVREAADRLGVPMTQVISLALDALERGGMPRPDHRERAVRALRSLRPAPGEQVYVGRLPDGAYEVAAVPQGVSAHKMAPVPAAWGYFADPQQAVRAVEEDRLTQGEAG